METCKFCNNGGAVEQSVAMNKLLRIVHKHPELLNELRSEL